MGAPSPLGGAQYHPRKSFISGDRLKMANEPEKGKTMNKVVSEKLTTHPSCSLKLIHSMAANFCSRRTSSKLAMTSVHVKEIS